MVISLIGMSGSGKTYWSKRLVRQGFLRYCCDDLIEDLLAVELRKYGYSGIQDVAKWMGQPYHKQYMRNSRRYLQLEKEVMNSILKRLDCLQNQDVVIDTTGSVIYVESRIMERLREYTKIICFSTPAHVQKYMYGQYLRDPKPVIWGGVFSQYVGESPQAALARCYPLLLSSRAVLYEKHADVILDYSFIRNKRLDVHAFLQNIL